jgi:CheY-like chemotaxis protein
VELHGGTVVAESAGPGQGATFCVRLPRHLLVPEPGPGADDPLAGGAALPLKGQPVMIVDDEPDAREMLHTLLSLPGATVHEADSARAALDALARCEPHERPAVIVTDLAMPGDDGYALLARLRAAPELAAIPVIALTAYASPDDRRRALAEGFAAYLTKPVDVEALITTITAVLVRGR